MKLNGEIFLERSGQYKLKETAILISGNAVSFISKIENLIIKEFTKNVYGKKNIIDLNVECFITGEITYHDHVTCRLNNVRVLTLGHKESEDLVCSVIKDKLVSQVNVGISIV